jgi:hypothetical protein
MSKQQLERKIAKMNPLIAVVIWYFCICDTNSEHQKYLRKNYKRDVRDEFLVFELLCGAANGTDRHKPDANLVNIQDGEWTELLKEFDLTPAEQRDIQRINAAVDQYYAQKITEYTAKQIQDHDEEIQSGTEKFTEEKKQRTMQPTQQNKRRQLYGKDKSSKWFDLSENITTLAVYITTQITETDRTGKKDAIFKTNRLLNEVYLYVSNVFDKVIEEHSTEDINGEVENEEYVIDAMNNAIGAENGITIEEWIAFLDKIPKNVVDIETLRNMRFLTSELLIFPADASLELTIHNLTRRLEALQDW